MTIGYKKLQIFQWHLRANHVAIIYYVYQ